MFTKYKAAIVAALILSACGGGSGSSPAASSGSSGATSGTVSGDCSVISVAPSIANATSLSGATISIAQNDAKYVIKAVGSIVSIAGNSNMIKMDDSSTSKMLTLSGNKNVLIFGKSSTADSFSVSGIENTIYIPESSPVVIANRTSMAGSNTVKCYKP